MGNWKGLLTWGMKFKVLGGCILGIKRVHLNNPFYGSQEFYLYVVVFLRYSLESVSATCKQLSQELMEKYEELKRMEGHNNEYRTEIKKVKPCVPGSQRWMYLWAKGRVGGRLVRESYLGRLMFRNALGGSLAGKKRFSGEGRDMRMMGR